MILAVCLAGVIVDHGIRYTVGVVVEEVIQPVIDMTRNTKLCGYLYSSDE